MVCFLTSVREVAPELHAPALDALMVAVDTLGHAPVALDHLEFHAEFSDWRVLNLRQVREAATLGGVLLDAEQALARFRVALYMLASAANAVQSAAAHLHGHGSRPVRRIGRDALQISVSGAIGSDAQLHEIDQHLVAVRAAPAHAIQGAGELLAEMDKALVFLRRANRRLQRGLERLDAVAARFHDLRAAQGSLNHALTRASPAIAAIATPFASSLRHLLRVIRGSNAASFAWLLQLVAGRRQDLRARTTTRFHFEFHRFSGPLEVCSRQDVAEVAALSRPRADESGVPSRRVVVIIVGVDSLLEANAMRQAIDAGVQDGGWSVHGLGSLATAQALHTRIALLGESLTLLLHPDAMDDDGVVHGPAFITNAEVDAKEILRILSDDATVAIPEARLLAQDVCDMAVASRAPADVNNPIRNTLHKVRAVLSNVRALGAVFVAGA